MVCATSSVTVPPNRSMVETLHVSTMNFSFKVAPLACTARRVLHGMLATWECALALPIGGCFLPTAIADGPATTNAKPTAYDPSRLVLVMESSLWGKRRAKIRVFREWNINRDPA